MKSKNILRFAIWAGAFAATQIEASVQEGHGGIDIRHADGTSEPIEVYLENRTSRAAHACGLMELNPGFGDSDSWKNQLNNVLASFHAKLPEGAKLLLKNFNDVTFYMLDLLPGDEIVFTNDDASIIGGKKFNGAIRVKNDVYIVKSVWEGYWARRQNDLDLSSQLARVVHEAAIGNYHAPTKADLGRVVVEILRNAGVFKDKGGTQEFSRLSGIEVARFLIEHNYKPAASDSDPDVFATQLKYIESPIKSFRSEAGAARFRDSLLPADKALNDYAFNFRGGWSHGFNGEEVAKMVRPPELAKYRVGDRVFVRITPVLYRDDEDTTSSHFEVRFYEIQDQVERYLRAVADPPVLCK